LILEVSFLLFSGPFGARSFAFGRFIAYFIFLHLFHSLNGSVLFSRPILEGQCLSAINTGKENTPNFNQYSKSEKNP
jgi:hypothetical protein